MLFKYNNLQYYSKESLYREKAPCQSIDQSNHLPHPIYYIQKVVLKQKHRLQKLSAKTYLKITKQRISFCQFIVLSIKYWKYLNWIMKIYISNLKCNVHTCIPWTRAAIGRNCCVWGRATFPLQVGTQIYRIFCHFVKHGKRTAYTNVNVLIYLIYMISFF